MKTIIHYENGEKYTYTKCTPDGCVDWDSIHLRLTSHNDDLIYVPMADDILGVEVRDVESGYYCYLTNPKRNMSVNIDAMTANTRSKKNRQLGEYLHLCEEGGYGVYSIW